ncbi:ubiquitin-conjugating enzyme/RWD-like protein [Obelidium mucronatum]|nr:ubiquitin-conjugating enzyme/RWD-like protein [Obelidium mucronatum]
MGPNTTSNGQASKRLLKELREMNSGQDEETSGVLVLRPASDTNLFEWVGVITTSEQGGESPFDGGRFKVAITVPETYPMDPPHIRFLSKVCHPNVHWTTGEICLDLLKTNWSPAWTLKSACLAISLLLDSPEPDSPLNCDIANLLRCDDRLGYDSLIRMYTMLYATSTDVES